VDAIDGAGQIYVDGVNQTETSVVTTNFGAQNDLNIGSFIGGSYTFHGSIDEARIQSGLASPSWIQATASPPATVAAVNSQPSIALLTNDGVASLRWPQNAGVYQLYYATNLSFPITWNQETNAPQYLNGQWQFPLFPSATMRFYRLQAR
jgi:hypothetical protein